MVASLVPILTSRFMLNLRQASERGNDSNVVPDLTRSLLTSDKFMIGSQIPQSVIDNLGEGFMDQLEVDS